jgi:hypothetical protein
MTAARMSATDLTPAEIEVFGLQHDSAWFAAHPHRSHRLRCARPDEHVSPRDAWVVIRQWKPGVRTLIAVALCDEFREIIVTTYAADSVWEELAWAVFDALIDADISRTDSVSRQMFASRLNLLAREGRA